MKSLPHESISNRYSRLKGSLTEQMRRLWAASEAIELGYGGTSAVARATGLMPATIRAGIAEITTPPPASLETKRGQRRPGGGRKSLGQRNPHLIMALEKLMEPYTSGDPMRPLRWTCKSTSELARELTKQGHRISADTVGRLLKASNHSLQGNRKRFEGKQHPDRNAQFEHIAATVEAFQAELAPENQSSG